MEITFEQFSNVELRAYLRKIDPSSCGYGKLGNSGAKAAVIERLQTLGAMPVEIKEFVDNYSGKDKAIRKGTGDGEAKEPEQPMFDGFEKAEAVIEGEMVEDKPEAVPAPMVEAMAAAPKVAPVKSAEAPKNDAEKKLQLLQELLGGGKKEIDEAAVKNIVANMLNDYSASLQHTLDEQAAQTARNVAEIVERMQAKGVMRIEVKLQGGDTKKIGVVHYKTGDVAKAASLEGMNILLVGPAGSGKTTCCEKVAEILGLPFHAMSVGPETMKSDLLGFVDAAGNYHTTELRRAFENGGLLLLDELDAGSAGSITVLNSLLANGYCAFPDGMVKRHPNFRCIAAANTFGRGADRMYVGRNQLDAATLDRFKVMDFDYDEAMERQLAGNDLWVDKVQRYRQKAFSLKLRVVISPRASIDGARLLNQFTEEEVEEMCIWKGLDRATVEKIRN